MPGRSFIVGQFIVTIELCSTGVKSVIELLVLALVQDIKKERPVKPYREHVIGRLCGLSTSERVKGLASV